MEKIITKIHNLIKETGDLIAFEEAIKHLMEETFTKLVSDAFVHMNEPTKEKAQKENHKFVRNHEKRTIESSITAGLGMMNMGGTGDVSVLAAARRMELMAFCQIASTLGASLILFLANIFASLL